MSKMGALQASGPKGGRDGGSTTSLCPPLNQMAPAGTEWVPGYATQAALAGAYDVDGSLGLGNANKSWESPRCREEGNLNISGSRNTSMSDGVSRPGNCQLCSR